MCIFIYMYVNDKFHCYSIIIIIIICMNCGELRWQHWTTIIFYSLYKQHSILYRYSNLNLCIICIWIFCMMDDGPSFKLVHLSVTNFLPSRANNKKKSRKFPEEIKIWFLFLVFDWFEACFIFFFFFSF